MTHYAFHAPCMRHLSVLDALSKRPTGGLNYANCAQMALTLCALHASCMRLSCATHIRSYERRIEDAYIMRPTSVLYAPYMRSVCAIQAWRIKDALFMRSVCALHALYRRDAWKAHILCVVYALCKVWHLKGAYSMHPVCAMRNQAWRLNNAYFMRPLCALPTASSCAIQAMCIKSADFMHPVCAFYASCVRLSCVHPCAKKIDQKYYQME